MIESNSSSRKGVPLGPRKRPASRPPLLSFSQENFHNGETLRLTLIGGAFTYQLGSRKPVATECKNARQATAQARKDLCP